MKRHSALFAGPLALLLGLSTAGIACGQDASPANQSTPPGADRSHSIESETVATAAGWTNLGPAVLRVSNYITTRFLSTPGAGLPPTPDTTSNRRPIGPPSRYAQLIFDHYDPASLSHAIWTNYLARTNRAANLFAIQNRAARPPIFAWNTNCWVWGSRGLLACSPMSEAELWPGNAPGQIPITALTRRHGYTRGHSMSGEAAAGLVGVKVWFYTAANQPVERTIVGQQTRFGGTPHRDYTIVLFDADLPAAISPLRVATNWVRDYPWLPRVPHPMAVVEQGKTIQSLEPPFAADILKGGDSGSPYMLPLPGELVFTGGTSTTGPDDAMQADMDALSRRARLSPARYRLQFVDLSRWPAHDH